MVITEELPDTKDRKRLPMMYVRVFRLMNVMSYISSGWHHILADGSIRSHRCDEPYGKECMKNW